MKVWTNYWRNRAADRMRRIRELETTIRAVVERLKYNDPPSDEELAAWRKVLEDK